MRVISLSWGRQSFSLAAMAALGEVERVDVALFADTNHERSETYEFAHTWAPWLEEHGLKVVRVMVKNTNPIDNGYGNPDIPAFTFSPNGRAQIRRQCTGAWKIAPMKRWLQANRNGQPVEQWIGITLDEYKRMKPSDVKYITHRWPLVDLRMTRDDCERWLMASGLPVPPKSSCVFCPYHDNQTWRELKASEDWQRVVDVDRSIRKARPPYDLFIHQARKPLDQVDLRTRQERKLGKGQLSMFEDECAGICGV